jgi:hypothetical protein
MSPMSAVGEMLMSDMLHKNTNCIPCGIFVTDNEEKASSAIRNTLNATEWWRMDYPLESHDFISARSDTR